VHVIGGLKYDSPIGRIFSYLELDKKIEFKEVEKTYRFIYPDVTINCFTDINKYKQELIENFPHEQDNIYEYFKISKKIWDEVINSYYSPNFFQFLSYPFRFPNLFKYRNKTFQELLDKLFNDDRLKEVLGSGWQYLGLNSSRISALYMIGMYMSYHSGGAWYPKGSYQAMSNAFADCFKENGGSLRLKARVKKLLIDKNKAIGVELEDGEKITSKYVISNADTKHTFLNLVGEKNLSSSFLNRIKHLQQSVSGIVVHLGVKMEISKELDCGCNMYFPDYGLAEHTFRLLETDDIETNPRKFGFGLSIPSLKDTEIAPNGCHCLDIIYMPASYKYKNNWLRENKEEYNELKEAISENLIQAAEELIPQLSNHIVVKHINTPLTFERYTFATEGGWYDVACIPEQSLLKRIPARTPIKNLYLTGAKTFPGPGMFAVILSGLFTADIILNRKLTGGKFILKELIN
jgi:phytoene dehydrogenase-like protein